MKNLYLSAAIFFIVLPSYSGETTRQDYWISAANRLLAKGVEKKESKLSLSSRLLELEMKMNKDSKLNDDEKIYIRKVISMDKDLYSSAAVFKIDGIS